MGREVGGLELENKRIDNPDTKAKLKTSTPSTTSFSQPNPHTLESITHNPTPPPQQQPPSPPTQPPPSHHHTTPPPNPTSCIVPPPPPQKPQLRIITHYKKRQYPAIIQLYSPSSPSPSSSSSFSFSSFYILLYGKRESMFRMKLTVALEDLFPL